MEQRFSDRAHAHDAHSARRIMLCERHPVAIDVSLIPHSPGTIVGHAFQASISMRGNENHRASIELVIIVLIGAAQLRSHGGFVSKWEPIAKKIDNA
jgi:hypothetical protein